MDKRSLKLKRGAAVLAVPGLLGAYGLGSLQPWSAAHAETAVSAPAAPALPLPTGLLILFCFCCGPASGLTAADIRPARQTRQNPMWRT